MNVCVCVCVRVCVSKKQHTPTYTQTNTHTHRHTSREKPTLVIVGEKTKMCIMCHSDVECKRAAFKKNHLPYLCARQRDDVRNTRMEKSMREHWQYTGYAAHMSMRSAWEICTENDLTCGSNFYSEFCCLSTWITPPLLDVVWSSSWSLCSWTP